VPISNDNCSSFVSAIRRYWSRSKMWRTERSEQSALAPFFLSPEQNVPKRFSEKSRI